MVRVRYSFGSRHTGRIENIAKQRPKYPDVMKDVIRVSDIILQILDARYIEEMRNQEVEQDLLDRGKKIIYILNKADLIDRKKVERNLAKDLKPYVFVSATKGTGSKELRNRIKIEAKKIELGPTMKRVQVGIIGYPNAGKSSIINLITRKGAAKTSKQAGYTKGMQRIRMTDEIMILDTPGVIPESKYSTDAKLKISADTKLGARTHSDVKDPEEIVHYLISHKEFKDEKNPTEKEMEEQKRAEKTREAIMKFYGLKTEGNVDDIIEELGKKKNFLKKGGIVNTDRTARLILKDWQEGNIKL